MSAAAGAKANELDGDRIVASGCVREASLSICQGLEMLFHVPAFYAGCKEIDRAQELMLQAQKHLQHAQAKIDKTPSTPAAQCVATGASLWPKL